MYGHVPGYPNEVRGRLLPGHREPPGFLQPRVRGTTRRDRARGARRGARPGGGCRALERGVPCSRPSARVLTLPVRALTILACALFFRRSSEDLSINRISRDDYLSIPNKTTTGRPNQYFVDRLITPVMKIWPSPENSTDQIIYDRLVRIDDADVSVNTVEIPFRFYPCLAAGLAYYISLKRAPDRIQILKGLYEEEFDRAAQEDRDKASVNLVPSFTFVTGV